MTTLVPAQGSLGDTGSPQRQALAKRSLQVIEADYANAAVIAAPGANSKATNAVLGTLSAREGLKDSRDYGTTGRRDAATPDSSSMRNVRAAGRSHTEMAVQSFGEQAQRQVQLSNGNLATVHA